MPGGARAWRGPAVTAVGAVVLVVGLVGALGSDGEGDDGEVAAGTTTSTTIVETTTEAPTTTTTVPATATTVALEEAIPAFLAAFDAALASGDPQQVLVLLHPAVFDVFDEESCRGYLAGIAGTPQPPLGYREHAAPGDFVWEVDGQAVTVPDAVAVVVVREIGGDAITQEIHVAFVDGELRNFIDCTGA